MPQFIISLFIDISILQNTPMGGHPAYVQMSLLLGLSYIYLFIFLFSLYTYIYSLCLIKFEESTVVYFHTINGAWS